MLVVVLFAISAALLIVLNKLCLQEANVPASLATVQFFITALTAHIVLQTRRADIQPFNTVWLLYIALFTISIYTNMRLLFNTGVAFVIVVRSCLPMSVSVLEYINSIFFKQSENACCSAVCDAHCIEQALPAYNTVIVKRYV